MKTKTQKIKLGKKTVSNLTHTGLSKLNGGEATWTIATTLASVLEQTCKCSFPPKCASDNTVV
jgi:hypothetical protein